VVSFTESGRLYRHDLRSGQTTLMRASAVSLDPAVFTTERAEVTSADGTVLPLFLTRRRGLPRRGDVPVLLYGYGGVGACTTSSFSAAWAVWLERGGMLAVASLRGGGEYGRAWHDAGKLANKQNVFDDFCACARWLASSGWSRTDRIAINGGSNGGLLVGTCLTQHPELFGAAVADVGVFDMLRFTTSRSARGGRPSTETRRIPSSIGGCAGTRRCTTCAPAAIRRLCSPREITTTAWCPATRSSSRPRSSRRREPARPSCCGWRPAPGTATGSRPRRP